MTSNCKSSTYYWRKKPILHYINAVLLDTEDTLSNICPLCFKNEGTGRFTMILPKQLSNRRCYFHMYELQGDLTSSYGGHLFFELDFKSASGYLRQVTTEIILEVKNSFTYLYD